MTGQVFAVASGKGGVGKTTTVVNLGVTIRADDHSVALVDADLGMANLATVLGIEHEPTLHDVLADRAEIEDAIVEQADRFAVVPGSRDLHGFAEADPTRLRDVIDELADRYEYVIIDTGAGLSHEDLLPLGLADQVLLITTPDPSSVGDTRKVAGFSDILGKAVRGIVVTKSRTQADADAAAEEFDTELLAAIPEDPKVVESTAKGIPLEVFDSETPAAAAYRKLAKKVTGESITAEHMPDELEEPATRGESDSEAESTEAESTEAESAAPESEPSAEAETPPTEEMAEIEEAEIAAEDTQPAEPMSTSEMEAETAAAEQEDTTAEPFGDDLSEVDDLLAGGGGNGPADDTTEPIETPTTSEASSESQMDEASTDEPTAEGTEITDGPVETSDEPEELPDESPEPSAPEETSGEPEVAEPEDDADDSAEVAEAADDPEKSKGFFGRLFGVFR